MKTKFLLLTILIFNGSTLLSSDLTPENLAKLATYKSLYLGKPCPTCGKEIVNVRFRPFHNIDNDTVRNAIEFVHIYTIAESQPTPYVGPEDIRIKPVLDNSS